MPLTPQDVQNKRFTPVRLREGYDMNEVDTFLDEVEHELERLIKENEDLRAKLALAQQGGASPFSVPRPLGLEPEPAAAPEPVAAAEPEAAPAPLAAPVAPVAAPEEIRVTNVAEASSAAARLLEIAGRNADEVVSEAKAHADQILGEARTKAERLDSESKTRAERLESDARTRSQMLGSETAERRLQLMGDLEKEKVRLNGEIETLRTFEREYRSRLKSYFSQQLAALDTGASEGGSNSSYAAGGEAPKRLKSLLGDDQG